MALLFSARACSCADPRFTSRWRSACSSASASHRIRRRSSGPLARLRRWASRSISTCSACASPIRSAP
eukprot:5629387-Prymnesium_polylepis.1